MEKRYDFLIKEIDNNARQYDKEAYSIEAKILYKNKEGIIITNNNENYHLYLEEKDSIFFVYSIKKEFGKYIPDFNQKISFTKLNFAVAKLFSELEKKKIKLFINEMRQKLNEKDINEVTFIESIMKAANIGYGIDCRKEKNKFIFEISDSVMEIIKTRINNKRVYKVYINNVFIYEYEEFLEVIEVSFLKFINNQFKKQAKKISGRGNFKLRNTPKYKIDIKE